MEDKELSPDNSGVDWERLRKFMRTAVAEEVSHALTPIRTQLKSHDDRVSVLETTVRGIENGVNAARWETANLAGMLQGFIGTKDTTGKFDVAMDATRTAAERANVLAHTVRDNIQTLVLQVHDLGARIDANEARTKGQTETRAEYETKSEKRIGILKWLLGLLGTGGVGGWILKHFRH